MGLALERFNVGKNQQSTNTWKSQDRTAKVCRLEKKQLAKIYNIIQTRANL